MIMRLPVGLGVIGMERMKNILYVKKELNIDKISTSFRVQFVVYISLFQYQCISNFVQ